MTTIQSMTDVFLLVIDLDIDSFVDELHQVPQVSVHYDASLQEEKTQDIQITKTNNTESLKVPQTLPATTYHRPTVPFRWSSPLLEHKKSMPGYVSKLLCVLLLTWSDTVVLFEASTMMALAFRSPVLARRPTWSGIRLFGTSPQNKNKNHHRISYLTDVEGDREYLERFVNISKVLKWEKDFDDDTFAYNRRLEFQRPHVDTLVFGGDVVDQGGADIWVLRQLVDFKKRYEDHVIFVLGNRDVNKMRIIQELGYPGETEAPPHQGVYWLHGSGIVGDPLLGSLSTDPVERLKWMLSQTMGSPKAFEYRRRELAQDEGNLPSDWDVVESYRSSCHPTGELGQYLSHGKLAFQRGDAFFVHGSLPLTDSVIQQAMKADKDAVWDDLTFAMPWLNGTATAADLDVMEVDDWLKALNSFAKEKIQNWRDCSQEENYWSRNGGYKPLEDKSFSPLIQYGMGWTPDGSRNPTCVYSSWSTNGMPVTFMDYSKENQAKVDLTRDFFCRAKVKVLCCGHQPQGDMPNPIHVGNDCWIICGDTSYSGDVEWYNQSNRNLGRGRSKSARGPVAVSEVILEQNEQGSTICAYSHGILSDGRSYQTLPYGDGVGRTASSQKDEGMETSEEGPPSIWWIRAKLTDGSIVHSAGRGFQQWNRILPMDGSGKP